MRSSGKALLHGHVLDALLLERLAALARSRRARRAPARRSGRAARCARPPPRAPRGGLREDRGRHAAPARVRLDREPPEPRTWRRGTRAGRCRAPRRPPRPRCGWPRGRGRRGRPPARRPARRRTRARAGPARRPAPASVRAIRTSRRSASVALDVLAPASPRSRTHPGAGRPAHPCGRSRRWRAGRPPRTARGHLAVGVLVARERQAGTRRGTRARRPRCPASSTPRKATRLPRLTACFWKNGNSKRHGPAPRGPGVHDHRVAAELRSMRFSNPSLPPSEQLARLAVEAGQRRGRPGELLEVLGRGRLAGLAGAAGRQQRGSREPASGRAGAYPKGGRGHSASVASCATMEDADCSGWTRRAPRSDYDESGEHEGRTPLTPRGTVFLRGDSRVRPFP